MADIKAIQQRVDREIGRRMALHVCGPLPAQLADRIDLLARLAECERERDEYELAIDEALDELGIPTLDYPAPVANGWGILRAVRDSETRAASVSRVKRLEKVAEAAKAHWDSVYALAELWPNMTLGPKTTLAAVGAALAALEETP